MKVYKDKLPPRYNSWLHLWDKCKDQIRQHDAIYISFEEYGDRYETTLEFIKAKCFDEFTESYSKMLNNVNDFMHPRLITLEIGKILEGKSYFIKPKNNEPAHN